MGIMNIQICRQNIHTEENKPQNFLNALWPVGYEVLYHTLNMSYIYLLFCCPDKEIGWLFKMCCAPILFFPFSSYQPFYKAHIIK